MLKGLVQIVTALIDEQPLLAGAIVCFAVAGACAWLRWGGRTKKAGGKSPPET